MCDWNWGAAGASLRRGPPGNFKPHRKTTTTSHIDDNMLYPCKNMLLYYHKVLNKKSRNSAFNRTPLVLSFYLLLILLLPSCHGEYVREFSISEGVPIGTHIGLIGSPNPGQPSPPQPPYSIVELSESRHVNSDLHIEESTGEIRTKKLLDHEIRSTYSFIAFPQQGENIRVVIKVEDENDNAPTFPLPVMNIAFPENTARDVKRPLEAAIDKDSGLFNTQRYAIVSGNKNSEFRLSSQRLQNGVLFLDLQINGFLDRETTEYYSLQIEAWDGGVPPLKGSMIVNITIQDINDNHPAFIQSRYFATVPENATIGTSVLEVLATDTDAGENGRITYSINRRLSDRDNMFQINPKTGVISVNRPLDFETKEVHELVVVAEDNGEQPKGKSAFVSIRVIDVNDNQPTINLIFLSDDATPKISEDAQPGEFVARISVNDPDSKEEYSNVNVTLEGGEGHFGLTTQDNIIYLMIVSRPLDRELKPNYSLMVIATDQGNPPLHASREFDLQVTDLNDNSPEFDRTVYSAYVLEVADPGTSVFQLSASDRDEGNNSLITYSIKNTPETHSDWFQIDSRTGLITTRSHVDCETEPVPQITVIATDFGSPAQSSSATVKVTIRDVNDNEPIFDQSFYNVSVQESEPVGNCILKVSAEDPDCGVNAIVNYTIGESFRKFKEFEIKPVSGDICISGILDHETRPVYEFPVVATDRGGLSTTAMVKVQLIDVNDNKPTFYPRQYNVSLRENHVSASPIVVVVATDNDSGNNGEVTYEMVGGNETELFILDSKTGGIFVTRPLSKTTSMYHLYVSAKDGAGVRSEHNAEITISVIDTNQEPPIFEKPRYTFEAREDIRIGHIIGKVRATSNARAGGGIVRYSIYSGDPNGYFSIDQRTGVLKTAKNLDHESQASVLLNVLATTGSPPTYGHTQVNISIFDVNDNSPEFDVQSVKISVPENTPLREAIYAAHASDQDSGNNGVITYSLLENPSNMFTIDKTGILMLHQRLDYETVQRYTLVIGAQDRGEPRLSSRLTVNMEVQDVNDNPPVFEKDSYSISVLESLPANSQFYQVTASDKDTGNNARLTYTIKEKEFENIFGVFPNSGSLYLKEVLDRETKDNYKVTVVATDNGTPVTTASTTVFISVLDANDNTPTFTHQVYEFTIEENLAGGTFVGSVDADDSDLGNNASLRYSLKPSSSNFKIDAKTGNITTVGPLDREIKAVYEVAVEVTDEGVPPRYSKATVRVLVTDVNDNSPTFIEPREASVSVREDQPAGTEVLQVRATDKDEGNNASITYSFFPTDDSDDHLSFTINPTTGVISTSKVLDHEVKARYSLVVIASDQGDRPKNLTKLIQIDVLDVNDNRPTFSASSLTFKVRESAPIGENVGTGLSSHKKASAQSDIMYSIIDGNVGNVFEINKKSGQIYTIKALDFESIPEYSLQIQVVNFLAPNPQDSILKLKIEVEDENDEVPVFTEDPIEFSISENKPIGSEIWTFTATDKDAGDNGRIEYSLAQQSPKKVFKLDAVTGVLSLMGPLDYEEQREFTLVVTASDLPRNDDNRLRCSVTAKIFIEDFNDNAPKFVSSDRIDVMEDEPIGFSMLHVVAVDEDSGDNGKVTYIISSGNDEGKFALDYETGVLTIVNQLDRELTTSYTLNVTASDHGKPLRSISQTIAINVQDVNDNAPKFSKPIYRANVSEGSGPGTFVTRVSASDRDSGSNGNLTFIIPAGIGDNKFRINQGTGDIHTVATLDREEKEQYALTVYVRDGSFPAQYDTASVLVSLTDVNDHAPEFRDSCYPLRVPENTDLSAIHTVLATDKDSNINSEVTYSLNGDFGNKFSIDTYTGQLSAKPLDREESSKYTLYITARDRGKSSQIGTCNITVTIEDQNDNDPKFSRSVYNTNIRENILPGTSVLTVEATDKDYGENAQITYSLSNETQWLFKIDNETGVISTTGVLDREKQDRYSFEVQATDGGQYDTRSETAHVEIIITDVNDNRPRFEKYPFKANIPVYGQPGQQLVQVTATDLDQGINSQIIYSLNDDSPHSSMFRINSDSGIITATSALTSENGKLYHLEVVARDRGSPSKSSTGLVEIQVGEKSKTTLKFQNSSYIVNIPENSPTGTDIVQVTAFRSDDRRERIIYSFGSGNEDNIFEINSNNGLIRLRNSDTFDYELVTQIDLVIVAQASGVIPLYAYANVKVNVVDMNDNSPRFTQDVYVSSVWEGNNKGAYVIQVSATDDDTGPNANIVYYIVDGNRDDAFIIDPPFSGIVKTNIVLDREIREAYQLTIIATDEGAPEMTGTCTLRINIVDVNDNQPTFPPHSLVQVSEGAEVGTVITTITANDVDTNPAITYNFAVGGNPLNMFTIDKFSGKITLAAPLDHEAQSQYTIEVEASDTAHIARTKITVQVLDENDNPPVFSQQAYQVTLAELSSPGTSVITVSTTDADKDINSEVKYSLSAGTEHGFYVNEKTGVIYSNTSHHYNPRQPMMQLVVTARDRGSPSMDSVAAVTVKITDANNNPPRFSSDTYIASIREDASRGHAVTRVSASDMDESRNNRNIVYSIVSGNDNDTFQIASSTGEIIVLKGLDREKEARYELVTLASDRGSPSKNATSTVIINISDVNDNIPLFNETSYFVNVSEALDPGSTILQVHAVDKDEGENAKIIYDITSGNEMQIFALDSESGVITLREFLDYDTVPEHHLIIRATDGQRHNSLSALTTVHIGLKDENDNAPKFPSPTYYELVRENSPIGTTVFIARANDADKGQFGVLNYSIPSGEDRDKFRINPSTGVVTTNLSFDFEERRDYKFVIRAFDAGGKFTSVNVIVRVDSVDEYEPVFTQSTYFFSMPVTSEKGNIVGRVKATDKDGSSDGQVFYSLKTPSRVFKINRTTGDIIVKRPPGREEGIRLELIASSGKSNSLKSLTIAEISIGNHNSTWGNTTYIASGISDSSGLNAWVIVLIVILVFIVVILAGLFVHYYRKNIIRKPVMTDQFDTSFDTIDIRHPPPANAPDLSQYPSSYNDLPYSHHADRSHHGNATSEMSEQSQSASSGRGSADDNEDVEDEEIRMINEGPILKEQKLRERLGLPSDSGIRDDDAMSDVSVHNTQEYLARLGIDTTKTESNKGSQDLTHSIGSMHMFDEEAAGDPGTVDINNLLYSKLNDMEGEEDASSMLDGGRSYGGFGGDESQPSMTGSLSSIVHSEEELQGSYNWDYLLDWGPQYQPLAHVFGEIARLKDDSAPNFNREPQKKTLNPQVKTIPPPLLTSVAPRSIAPVALSTIRSQMAMPSLARSPISHESSYTSSAMSPSFSPSLSPLATRSPSISPLMTPGHRPPAPGLAPQNSVTSTPHHPRNLVQRQGPAGLLAGTSSGSENELRL